MTFINRPAFGSLSIKPIVKTKGKETASTGTWRVTYRPTDGANEILHLPNRSVKLPTADASFFWLDDALGKLQNKPGYQLPELEISPLDSEQAKNPQIQDIQEQLYIMAMANQFTGGLNKLLDPKRDISKNFGVLSDALSVEKLTNPNYQGLNLSEQENKIWAKLLEQNNIQNLKLTPSKKGFQFDVQV
ncbi:MAG: hypothetical protein VKJ06_08480 [Vampirovibrionales bacterium]|nr:hypothetical protein [Vampirovibrionales bacterium]